ncbi:LysM peptidoglycan-binding domain-containing protein [Flavobacterium luteum]|uniref:LysM peptidoglycan-binding domain-containing protein n=1 Tax=Flavobacterium luteum TaxID=2026654 RepID=A0A7J5AEX0_9FLAO|nr:LysM peptidoglycan-binding domain-containing protein [Flavobacterium luteum]KAB1155529.1 LysM peptidoglycan-binding domain-containing protein [Flavobacterium luteum]
MRKLILIFFVIRVSLNSFGQDPVNDQQFDLISHEVQLDESVRTLSKKYLVDSAEIYRLNRFAINGISQGMVLQIPVLRKNISIPVATTIDKASSEVAHVISENKIEEKPLVKSLDITVEKATVAVNDSSQINHIVEPKETLYGLSKKYNVSVEEIKLNNKELLIEGLKIGQVIRIYSKKVLQSTESKSLNKQKKAEIEFRHKVEPKETLYAISKKYNISIDEIKQHNEFLLQNGLQIGQTLIIKSNN